MNILIDINHPAHVHMFHYFALEMQSRGHRVLFVCRDKEFEVRLLTQFGLPFVNLGRKHTSLPGKLWDQLRFTLRIWREARRMQADVLVSHGSLTATMVSRLIRRPHITFEDTFNMEQVGKYAPFASVIFTATYDNPLQSRPNVLRYSGYKELLYLHPHQFTPDVAGIRRDLGLASGEEFIILRFVAWNATHDKGHRGLSEESKRLAVSEFSRFGRVFISAEGALPASLEPYRFPLSPDRMHDAEAAAALIFGESSTMVAEGAVLGTPGIFLDNTGRLFTRDIADHYQLCFCYSESPADQQLAIEQGVRILSGAAGIDFAAQRSLLLSEKIDVTSMFCWFIESYPESEQAWRTHRPSLEPRFK